MPKLVNEGENEVLNHLLPATLNLYIGLYQNVTEPAETDTLTELTEVDPADFSEGHRQILPGASWTIVADVATHIQQVFTGATTVGNVYGYFLTDISTGTAGKLWGVENFSDGPYNILADSIIKITPKLTAS